MLSSASSSPIELDGSLGEGGGQILRTALALSMVTGRPFHLRNIRAKRAKPGLMRQHLTAVLAAAEVCSAAVDGADLRSTEIRFVPGAVRPGEYHFKIATAGSTTLVLQTVLPALMIADGPSTVTIEGGTHNLHAPPADFLQSTFLPLLARIGPQVNLTLDQHGFYPVGGGRIRAEIIPAPTDSLQPLSMLERGEITDRRATVILAGLPGDIALRELAIIGSKLGWPDEHLKINQLKNAAGVGNVISIALGSRDLTEVITAFGRRGVTAESVAESAVDAVRSYLRYDAPVGEHLADQLLIPLAMAAAMSQGVPHVGGADLGSTEVGSESASAASASGASVYRTGPPTSHTLTNAEVIMRFLPVRIEVERHPDRTATVAVFGA